jgi:hypothetical protein
VIVSSSASDVCQQAPSVSPTEKRVAQENWPDFVQIVIAKLPPRSDYIMQSGYALCKPEPSGELGGGAVRVPPQGADEHKIAYAVINLGGLREHGHLTVNLAQTDPGEAPQTCAAVQQQLDAHEVSPEAPKPELLFCEEATATAPLVFATRMLSIITATAAYDDFRVWMESIATDLDQQPEIGPEALRAVVTDPALAALNQ